MFLRIVVFLGVALVLAAGGAAGWQYWQSLPQAAVAETDVPAGPTGPQLTVLGQFAQTEAPKQTWLISPGGGLVPRDDVRQWLKQDAFVEGRGARIKFTAPLASLLDEGEVLPGLPYRAAFADIRAKKLAQDFCAPLMAKLAATCAVASAEIDKGSLDAAGETASFDVELVYALVPEAGPLPDLGTRTLQTGHIRILSKEAGAAAESPISFLTHTLALAEAACAEERAHCRITRVYVEWDSQTKANGSANFNWLAPLPEGMYAAPPLH